MPSLAVVGNLSRDLVDEGPPRVGGAPFHAARALRVLGGRPLVVAKCAAADRRELLPPLIGLGVPVLCRASWVHVGALAHSDFPAETLAELARERLVSLDGQGLVRPARTGPLELDAGYDPEVLRHVSVLNLAEEEARVLLGEPDEESLRSL